MSNHINFRAPRAPEQAALSGAFLNPRIPSIPLTQVFERINPKGKRYLVGRIGTAKLLIVATGTISRGEPVWQVFLGEGPLAPEGVEALAQVEGSGRLRLMPSCASPYRSPASPPAGSKW